MVELGVKLTDVGSKGTTLADTPSSSTRCRGSTTRGREGGGIKFFLCKFSIFGSQFDVHPPAVAVIGDWETVSGIIRTYMCFCCSSNHALSSAISSRFTHVTYFDTIAAAAAASARLRSFFQKVKTSRDVRPPHNRSATQDNALE